ncbi:MAG: hypothetical protein GY913_13555 [Proteobacteria bacterium]|nr:hypothetical protein [Pseudomonadota bacterium]MCP4917933.1 hypothetical protein [Pseudomonadota bacterium]
MRTVYVHGVGLLCGAGIGVEGAVGGRRSEVPGFRARAYVENRKNLKLMSRSVKLGVSGIRLALSDHADWEPVEPGRRGMFVGSTPLGGEMEDLVPALEVATDAEGNLDLRAFAEQGYDRIHPLWLVKGLSNNVLGFASASHDFQGVNANYCDGDASGLHALCEGIAAIAEDRADVVVAGASDAWIGLDPLLGGRRCGEGAAFFSLSAKPGRWRIEVGDGPALPDEEAELGYLGAAALPVALARTLLRGENAGLIDPGGRALRLVTTS